MIEFIKVRNVKTPIRNAKENAGIDFFVPEIDAISAKELADGNIVIDTEKKCIVVEPHKAVIIPSGIKSKFPNNLALIANNKSGIASKKQLIFGASVIDCSYQGEWHFNLINTSDDPQYIEFGQKIIQFIPTVIDTEDFVMRDMTEEEFYTEKTNRGDGWAGSTGV